MDKLQVSQFAEIRVTTYELDLILRGLERVDTQDGKVLKLQLEEVYLSMTGSNYCPEYVFSTKDLVYYVLSRSAL